MLAMHEISWLFRPFVPCDADDSRQVEAVAIYDFLDRCRLDLTVKRIPMPQHDVTVQ